MRERLGETLVVPHLETVGDAEEHGEGEREKDGEGEVEGEPLSLPH